MVDVLCSVKLIRSDLDWSGTFKKVCVVVVDLVFQLFRVYCCSRLVPGGIPRHFSK